MDNYLSKPIRSQELDDMLDQHTNSENGGAATKKPSDTTEPSVCAEELLERVDGDLTFVQELVDIFRADYEVASQIRTAG
jgi:YesN/AraC family two-component response regulator